MVSSTTVLLQVILVSTALVASATPGDDGAAKKAEPTVTAGDEPVTTVRPPPPTSPTLPGRGEPKDVSILKQINKVNDDGSYTYGYEASDGSFKVETRDVAGNVKGMFGFVDEAGRLKRVSYSASNSTGFQAAGSTSSSSPLGSSATSASPPSSEPPSAQKSAAATTAVKKVLVSKRPVLTAAARDDETDRRRREGNDPRRQLPRNDDGDAPDVYGGVHGRSSMESGPVSPVVSALMSELQLVPVRAYRPTAQPPPPPPTTLPANTADEYEGIAYARQDTISSRQAQEDDEPQYRPVTVQYRKPQPTLTSYQQQQPSALPTVVYQQQQQQQQPQTVAAYGPNLMTLRDELMELILTFVQARVSQLVSLAPPSPPPLPLPAPPYPMPYQQPNYYVPSYYQGPRMPPVPSRQPAGGFVLQQLPSARLQPLQDDYVAAAAADAPQQSSPRVTQALKDGLIRMLLATSPRYDPDRNRDWSTPSATFRRTTQSTPVRSVQIVQDDNADSRPVTTESPD